MASAAPSTSQQFIGLNGNKLELTPKVCNNLLKVYVDKAYKESGVFSIKNGADLHRYFRVLNDEEKDETLTPSVIYVSLCKTLEFANTKKVFGLDDAAVIAKLVEYINSDILVQVAQTSTEDID
jgi:hypothetical protein